MNNNILNTRGKGHDKLHTWFGLSYASWLTLPRVLMQEMPDKWQGKMADLLNEWYETYPNLPDMGTRVQITDNSVGKGKLIKVPQWLINYRHPDFKKIDELKNRDTRTWEERFK